MRDRRVPCEVVIFAHNEAHVIRRTVRQVQSQQWSTATSPERIVVVSTASHDGTDELVQRLALKDPRVRLLAVSTRMGKVYDVNLAVRSSAAPILVLMDADVELSPRCLPALVEALADPHVGVATAWRTASNPTRGIVNLVAHLAAEVHNFLHRPHAGQVLAICREIAEVDVLVAVDDAYQEFQALRSRLKIVRVKEAVVRARGPSTVRDYIRQRRRVTAQQIGLERLTGYRAATRSIVAIARAVKTTETIRVRRRYDALLAAMLLEVAARTAARWDVARGRSYHTWKLVESTRLRA